MNSACCLYNKYQVLSTLVAVKFRSPRGLASRAVSLKLPARLIRLSKNQVSVIGYVRAQETTKTTNLLEHNESRRGYMRFARCGLLSRNMSGWRLAANTTLAASGGADAGAECNVRVLERNAGPSMPYHIHWKNNVCFV